MTRARDLADFNLDGKAVTINESSADLDFRVESNGNANMLFVDGGNDKVGIGTNSPDTLLHITGASTTTYDATAVGGQDTAATLQIQNTDNNADVFAAIDFNTNNDRVVNRIVSGHGNTTNNGFLAFVTENSGTPAEAMRIDSGGNVGIGTTAPDQNLHVHKGSAGSVDSSTAAAITIEHSSDTALQFLTPAANQAQIRFGDPDNNGVGMLVYDHGDNSMTLRTNAEARMAIDSAGKFTVSNTAYFASLQNSNSSTERSMHYQGQYLVIAPYQDVALILNRMGSDGSLIHLRQAGTTEGTISVSGTTVSYNGGHLSRWSQLTDGTKDDAIVKGTVMTNLDQMAVWSHDAQAATQYEEGEWLPEGKSVGDEKEPAKDAYTEDNEQLNCMAVSSVEGDTNVAGVFVNWDDDDDFNDMNVAMTGDMVIRIAQGTTVARGDLLMSAGDGTAKPQGDDIVRSKTIAKVTSTTKSHTYDDGSYLVPCVLMAC